MCVLLYPPVWVGYITKFPFQVWGWFGVRSVTSLRVGIWAGLLGTKVDPDDPQWTDPLWPGPLSWPTWPDLSSSEVRSFVFSLSDTIFSSLTDTWPGDLTGHVTKNLRNSSKKDLSHFLSLFCSFSARSGGLYTSTVKTAPKTALLYHTLKHHTKIHLLGLSLTKRGPHQMRNGHRMYCRIQLIKNAVERATGRLFAKTFLNSTNPSTIIGKT